MARVNQNRLLVEGDEEKRVLPFLMDRHIVWGDRKEDWAVEIKEFGGVEPLLKPGVIEEESKTSGLRALGIIVDANDHIDSRWVRIKDRWPREFGALPEDLPADGLIHQGPKGPRVGVWIMPDNSSRGMLETFLGELLKPELAALWEFARESCGHSRNRGATYRDAHCDKANIHTYLAWLDPPGMSLHVAVMSNAVETKSALGERFVRWFMKLFDLQPRPIATS